MAEAVCSGLTVARAARLRYDQIISVMLRI